MISQMLLLTILEWLRMALRAPIKKTGLTVLPPNPQLENTRCACALLCSYIALLDLINFRWFSSNATLIPVYVIIIHRVGSLLPLCYNRKSWTTFTLTFNSETRLAVVFTRSHHKAALQEAQLVEEITSVLIEWNDLWKRLYIVST